MTDLATLTVRLETEIAKFTEGLDKATGALNHFSEHVTDTLKDVAGAFGLYLSVDALVDWGKSLIEQDANLARFSQQTGIAVEQLSALDFALESSGVAGDKMGTLFRDLQKSISEAAGDASSKAAVAFKAIGVNVLDANGHLKDNETILKETADKFAGFSDGANKTAIAVALLGRSGEDLIPALDKGGQGITDLEDKARQLGITIDTKTAKAAEDFETDATSLGLVLKQGLGERIKADLLPSLDALVKGFTDTATEGKNLDNTAEGIADFLRGLVTVGLTVGGVFVDLGKTIGGLAAAIAHPTQALSILKELNEDLDKTDAQVAAHIQAVWSTTTTSIDKGLQDVSDSAKKATPNLAAALEQQKNYDAGIKALQAYDAELQKQIGAFGKGKDATAAYALSQGELQKALSATGAEGAKLKDKILSDAAALQTQKDAKLITESLETIKASIDKLQGDTGDSAIAELDKKNAAAITAARHQGNTEYLQSYDLLVKLTAAQEDYNKDLQTEQQIQKTLSDTIAILDIQKQKGSLTDAQYQTAENAAYAQAAANLATVRDNMQQIATQTHNVGQQQGVDDLTAKIAKLGSQADVAGAKLRTAFEDDAVNALSEFEHGTKSAGAAFTDFIGGIADDLLKLANQALVQQAFSFLTGATGGGAGGGTGIFGTLAGLFGGGKAAGGNVNAGSMYKINEGNPDSEWFVAPQNGKVVPSSGIGGQQIVQHFVIQAPQGTVSRQTQLQIAANAAKGLATGARRNG